MFTNRWYQDEAEYSLFEYFNQGKTGNPVLALPTGTGKSIVIANFLKRVFHLWPNQRVLMLTHVKELIKQNADKLLSVWPTAPLGIYSAGLRSRDLASAIVFGGIQSVYKAIERHVEANEPHFGHRDLVIIDECHLLGPSEDSMYGKAIAELKRINPYLKVIGLTATPYRMKQGLITDGGLFTDICYDITGIEAFNRLIAEGFIAPLIPRRTNAVIDTSNVRLIGGEFNKQQLAKVTNQEELTFNALQESLELGHDRHCVMVFASNIEHCEMIHNNLDSMGVNSVYVHSKIKKAERNERLAAFQRGEVPVVIGHGILTTGFDHPPIDLIIDLAPTASPGRHVQKNGRGTRPYNCNDPQQYIPGFDFVKENCLVLDFAGNTKRLGPINDPIKPRKPGQKEGGDAPVRICEQCGMYNHASVRFCESCGFEFTFETKLFKVAGTDELLRSDEPVVEYYNVSHCAYNLHEKKGKPPSIKVSYYCGLLKFNEWIFLEHGGIPAKRSRDWWRKRHDTNPPPTTYQALQMVKELRVPKRIRVWVNKKHPEILGAEW